MKISIKIMTALCLSLITGQNAFANANSGQNTARGFHENLADQRAVRAQLASAQEQFNECMANASRNGSPTPRDRGNCETTLEQSVADINAAAGRSGITPTSNVASSPGAQDDLACKTFADKVALELDGENSFKAGTSRNNRDRGYPGSDILTMCSKMTELDWKDAISSSQDTIWDKGWKEFANSLAQKIQSNNDNCGKVGRAYSSIANDVKRFTNQLADCEALRRITAKSDFNNQKQVAGGKIATQTSLDQRIKCESRGIETRDYKACVDTLNFYNGALVGETVFTQVQELGYQGHAIENSFLDPNDPTSALRAQQKDIQKRAGMTQTRAGLDVAKGAGLLALWQSIPTSDQILKECDTNYGQRTAIINRRYQQLFQLLFVGSDVLPDRPETRPISNAKSVLANSNGEGILDRAAIAKSCQQQVQGQYVIINESARNALKESMILAGIDGIKHQTAANLLKKQANQVGKIINEVDNFNPVGLEYFGDEFNGSECALNPAAEGCSDYLNQRSFGFGSNAPIQIHGMENASMFGRNDSEINNGTRDAASSPVDRADAPRPIGIFDKDANNPSGITDRTRAASVSSDGAASAGGGGGGGGVGGGGSPPAAPGGPVGSDAPRMGLPGAGSSNLAYSRGTGALRGLGGSGAQGNRNRDGGPENPFAGLFGSDGPQGANLNFREAASEDGQINRPDTSIFQIISDRYIAVHQNDRLLLYEAKEDQGPLQ